MFFLFFYFQTDRLWDGRNQFHRRHRKAFKIPKNADSADLQSVLLIQEDS